MKKAVLLLGLGLFACKSNEEKAAPQVEAAKAAVTPAEEPNDVVYAASAHLRLVDARAGLVVKKIDMQKAVRTMLFTKDGARAYVAASDGVREVDTQKQEVVAKLTEHPARNIELSDDGQRLLVLEHDVIVQPDETVEVLPFRLVTIDIEKRTVLSTEEIGQRILYAHPPENGRFGVVVFERGDIKRIPSGGKLSDDGVPIDPLFGVVSRYGARVREGSIVRDGRAYLPVEAEIARVAVIDLTSGEATPIMLGKPYSLRGLAFSPDGAKLYVNAGLAMLAIDAKTRAIGETLELGAAHTGLSIASNGRFAYLAQTVDGTGGAIGVVALDPLRLGKKIHLDDISPWALAVQPRAQLAIR